MKKATIALFLLAAVLSGCAPAAPVNPPTATSTPSSTAVPTQTSTPTPAPSPTARPFQLQPVAQMGGSIHGITIVGDLAYVGMGPRVAAIDVRRHDHPQLVAQSEPLPGQVTLLLQIPGGPAPLLLVSAGRHLVEMDITTPGELKPVRQLELEGEVAAMVLDDKQGILYAGGPVSPAQAGFISAVRLGPDNELSVMNSVPMPEGRLLSIALGPECLYAGLEGDDTGLYYIKLKTPGEMSTARLVLASDPLAILHPMSIQVIRKWLYLSYMDIVAFDISDPDVPVQIWGEWGSGEARVIDDFILAGDQAYYFGWTILSEYVHDVLPLPERIVGQPMGNIAAVSALHNGDFLVAYNDLEIFDTADPQALKLVGSYQPPVTHALGAVANEEAVFVLDNGVGDGHGYATLWALSLPDLQPLGQVTTETPNTYPGVSAEGQWISLEGDRLYLASRDHVWVYDVSRNQPVLLGGVGVVEGEVQAIAATRLGGKRLLAIAQASRGFPSLLQLFDLTYLNRPARLGSPVSLKQKDTNQMTWDGSDLYILLEKDSYADYHVYVMNFEDDRLTEKESLELAGYIDTMAVENKSIAVTGTEKDTGVAFLSVVASEPLRLMSQTTLPGRGQGVTGTGDNVLVVVNGSGGAQLLVYSVRDPAHPRQVQALDIPSSGIAHVSILVSGPYAVLANGAGGVQVFSNGR